MGHQMFGAGAELLQGGAPAGQKNPYARSPGEACQLPNRVHKKLPGSAGGCSVVAFSPSGRFLAAACSDGADHFKVHASVAGGGLRSTQDLCSALTECFRLVLSVVGCCTRGVAHHQALRGQ
jgi:hypothetical protein